MENPKESVEYAWTAPAATDPSEEQDPVPAPLPADVIAELDPNVTPTPTPDSTVGVAEPEQSSPVPPTPPTQTVSTATIGAPRPIGVAYDGRVYRKRTDNDVLCGHFCEVVDGEHKGRYGVLESTATLGIDGYPDQVVVLTRDANAENILVPYANIRPAEAGGR